MSPDLIAFLKAWHDWATSGAPKGEPFSRDDGLCYNAMSVLPDAEADRVWKELRDIFGEIFPFGGDDEYQERAADATQHECPKRLAWVRERLVEAGELVA